MTDKTEGVHYGRCSFCGGEVKRYPVYKPHRRKKREIDFFLKCEPCDLILSDHMVLKDELINQGAN